MLLWLGLVGVLHSGGMMRLLSSSMEVRLTTVLNMLEYCMSAHLPPAIDWERVSHDIT